MHQAHLRPQEYKCHHLCDGIFSKIKSFISIRNDDVTVLNLWLMLPVHLSDKATKIKNKNKTFLNHAKKETLKKQRYSHATCITVFSTQHIYNTFLFYWHLKPF